VIPLSEPLRTASGDFTESVCIPKGAVVVIPLAALNCSVSMWGPDAKKFKPSRWLEEDEGTTHGARTLQGYRHIMTFGDGARMCPGRLFALTEFKVRSCTLRASVPDLFDQVWIRSRLYCSFLCETLCLRWQMALRCRSQRVWGLCPDRGWLGVLRLEMCLSACVGMKFDSYTIQLAPPLTQVIWITIYGS
jgi:hypothetical protein